LARTSGVTRSARPAGDRIDRDGRAAGIVAVKTLAVVDEVLHLGPRPQHQAELRTEERIARAPGIKRVVAVHAKSVEIAAQADLRAQLVRPSNRILVEQCGARLVDAVVAHRADALAHRCVEQADLADVVVAKVKSQYVLDLAAIELLFPRARHIATAHGAAIHLLELVAVHRVAQEEREVRIQAEGRADHVGASAGCARIIGFRPGPGEAGARTLAAVGRVDCAEAADQP
jgi:hypothetical protein